MPGDYNEDGMVDTADHRFWRDRMGLSMTLAGEKPAAATLGVTDMKGFEFWKLHFGASLPDGASVFYDVVPEPATWLATIAVLVIAGLRVKKRRKQKM